MSQSEPKPGLKYFLKLTLVSLGLIVGGGVLFLLATMTGRVFPFVAFGAVVLAIVGTLGLLLAIGVPLLERRQALDGAAMGFAFQNLEIPDDITQEMNALNAEISRREALS